MVKRMALIAALLLVVLQCTPCFIIASETDLTKLQTRAAEIESIVAFEKNISPNIVSNEQITAIETKAASAKTATAANAAAELAELEKAYLEYRSRTLFDADFNAAAAATSWNVVNINSSVVADAAKGFAAKLDAANGYARMTQDFTPDDASGDTFIFNNSFMQTTRQNVAQILDVLSNGFEAENYVFNLYADGGCFYIKYGTDAAGSSTAVGKVLHGYQANTWYNFSVGVDFSTRRIRVFLNNAEVLADTNMYIMSAKGVKGKVRVNCRMNDKGVTYIADTKFLAADSVRNNIIDIDNRIKNHFSERTGYEDVIELPVISGAAIAWSSGAPKYISRSTGDKWYVTYPTDNDVVGKMRADVTVTTASASYTYSKEYDVNIKKAAAFDKSECDYDFDTVTRFSELGNRFAAVCGAPTFENGALKLENSKVLYNIPYNCRPAGIEVVEFKFRQEKKQPITHIARIANDSGAEATRLQIIENDVVMQTQDGIEIVVPNYETGKEYIFKYVLNFNTRKFRIIVNDKLYSSNGKTDYDMRQAFRNIGCVSFDAKNSNFIIDDFSMYTCAYDGVDVSLYENGGKITGLANVTSNTLTAKADLYSLDHGSLTFAVAVYDGDSLYGVEYGRDDKEIKIDKIQMPTDERGNVKLEDTVVKLYLWDSITNMIPYQDVIKISKENSVDKYTALASFTVSNRNANDEKNVLIQRGIPLPKGVLYSIDNVYVKNTADDAIAVAQADTIQRYDDGSIEWASFAFSTDLASKETKKFELIKYESEMIKNKPVKAERSSASEISLSNDDIKVDFNGQGIAAIWYNGTNILNGNGVKAFVENSDGISYTSDGTVEIYEQGPVYTSVKISGNLSNGSGMRVHQIFRVPAEGTRIHSEVMFEMCNGEINGYETVKAFGYDYALKTGFIKNEYPDEGVITGDVYKRQVCK